MNIRKATESDLEALMPIFEEARGTIAALGIDQWQDGYPSREIIHEDVVRERSYLAEEDGTVCGSFAMLSDGEPVYDTIHDGHWMTGDGCRDYIAIHRVAVSVRCRGKGVSGQIISYVAKYAQTLGRRSLRIDTHEGNIVMRRMLEKNGFSHCGTVVYPENREKRVAYEKIV